MRLILLASTALAVLGLATLPLRAEEVTGSGTLVMNDHFHTQTEWGESLVLPKPGKIVRVMDGTYGFDLKTAQGVKIASFLDPQQAVGMSLPAGTYILDPYVCKRHRHHHIEVTAAY
ncbi:MAG TPA: hypothetical protein VF449_11190 [Parvibaculum sp.]